LNTSFSPKFISRRETPSNNVLYQECDHNRGVIVDTSPEKTPPMRLQPEDRSASSSSSSSSTDESSVVVARRAPARRVHCKSRLGCFSCKRRRVKCDERRPACAPCSRLALQCDYPPRSNGETRGGPETPRPALNGLALEDLRFHYQFLTVAYPSLPLRGDAVWQKCAAMTHCVSSSDIQQCTTPKCHDIHGCLCSNL
jgi:hypothetical protein